jgi:hypothetical protein
MEQQHMPHAARLVLEESIVTCCSPDGVPGGAAQQLLSRGQPDVTVL